MNRGRFVAPVLLVLVGLAIAGCTLFGGASTYRGTVAFGFEVEGFTPCAGDASWWITAAPADLRARYRAAVGFAYRPVYVVVEGTIGPAGSYGHLGSYDHEIAITRLLEMDPQRGSC